MCVFCTTPMIHTHVCSMLLKIGSRTGVGSLLCIHVWLIRRPFLRQRPILKNGAINCEAVRDMPQWLLDYWSESEMGLKPMYSQLPSQTPADAIKDNNNENKAKMTIFWRPANFANAIDPHVTTIHRPFLELLLLQNNNRTKGSPQRTVWLNWRFLNRLTNKNLDKKKYLSHWISISIKPRIVTAELSRSAERGFTRNHQNFSISPKSCTLFFCRQTLVHKNHSKYKTKLRLLYIHTYVLCVYIYMYVSDNGSLWTGALL